jgi:hypothetical protein
MNRTRGSLLLIAGCVAFYQGWKLHSHAGHYTLLSVGLGLLAWALGFWRLTHK